MRADFVSQAYFRNPAAEIEKLRSAGPVVEVQFPMIGKVWTTTTQDLADRVLKDSETFTIRTGDRRRRRIAMVDAAHPADARQPYAVDGRTGSQKAARYCRRSLSPPGGSRDGAAHPCHRRRTRRRTVRRGKSGRSRRSLCADTAAVGDLRASRPAARRSAEIHRLGERLHALHRHHRPPEPDPQYFRDAALSGKAAGSRQSRMAARVLLPNWCASKRKADKSAATRWWPWSFCCCSPGTKRPRI